MRHVYDKYELYELSVQNPESEIDFFSRQYRRLRNGRDARVFREDFCGTGVLACGWAASKPTRSAIGIDLDPQPIEWGLARHYLKLKPAVQERVKYIEANVLKSARIKADIVAALNFSYFIFKERATLLAYFKQVRAALNPQGLFFLDIFGGVDAQMPSVEKRRQRGFTYHWDCKSFNPINNHCKFAIHFSFPPKARRKKMRDAFTYDWRLWSVTELREILAEAGFKQSLMYWEGDDNRGGGNGIFRPTERVENCESWIGYVVGIR